MAEIPSTTAIPVALLAQVLIELREARGNKEATRAAAVRYFRNGLTAGYQVGPLLNWLFFWPSRTDSVFWQVRFPAPEGSEFVQMLKKLPVQELGLTDTESGG